VGLAGRHFGDNCVHHLTMPVDFERQVLAHFHGCPAALRRPAKEFVRRVNANSCDYLEAIAQAVRLAEEFSLTSQPERPRSGMWQRDAAAVLASSLTLAAVSSCTHVCEVAPQPIYSVTARTVVDPPPPPIITLAKKQKAISQEKLLPKIAAWLPKPAPLKVRAVFGDRGQWNSGEVFHAHA
jgi:hypothetical protein